MIPLGNPGQRLQAGAPAAPLRAGKWEVRMAHTLMVTVLALMGLALFEPAPGTDDNYFIALLLLVGLPLYFSWLGLLGIHVGRIVTGRYSWKAALMVLFIPFFGLLLVTLRLERS